MVSLWGPTPSSPFQAVWEAVWDAVQAVEHKLRPGVSYKDGPGGGMGNPIEKRWEKRRKSQENHRKTIGKPWRKNPGKPWEHGDFATNNGDFMVLTIGKTIGKTNNNIEEQTIRKKHDGETNA